ncbi:MAG TPA: high-potential iron-sulfur protein [Dokdonella sp.]|nr:high-potential iron-sulfur protein [Dokdonella sp.]
MSDPAESQARRRFLKIAVVGAAVAPVAAALLPSVARAQDPTPHVDPTNDPIAKSLAYTEDASTAKADPVYKEGSSCSNCNFYKGHEEMTFAPCDLFPGKVVSAKGWCKSWTKKV